MIKNTKKIYQFNDFLIPNFNQKNSVTISKKVTRINNLLSDSEYDQNINYKSLYNTYSHSLFFWVEKNEDLDFLLSRFESDIKPKKLFFVSQNEGEKAVVYFTYAYANNLKVSYDETNRSDLQISVDFVSFMPFYYRCDTDLLVYNNKNNEKLYGYDYITQYNSTYVYDNNTNEFLDFNNLSKNESLKYIDCCQNRELLEYFDFFDLTNVSGFIPKSKVATRTTPNKMQIQANQISSNQITNLNLKTSRKSEIIVIHLTNIVQNYKIKIKNIDNNSEVEFVWLSPTNNGQAQDVQIYLHNGQVFKNNQKMDMVKDYSLVTTTEMLYFDAFLPNPMYKSNKLQKSQNALKIDQSQVVVNNNIYIETLPTFF